MTTMLKFTLCLSRNWQKIKKPSILINVFKKASMQIKPENFKSVCNKIYIYDSEKAYKDYNIFSTMYKKCKKMFKNIFNTIHLLIFLFYMLCFNVSTTHKIYLSIMKNHKSFRRWKSEKQLHSKLIVAIFSIEIFITGFK